MSKLRALLYGLRRAVSGIVRRPLRTVFAIGVVAVTSLLALSVLWIASSGSQATQAFQSEARLVVYLDDGLPPERARAIASVLERVTSVTGVDYVPPDEAMRRLRAELGPDASLLSGLDAGFAPASLEVSLAPGADRAALAPLIEKLESTPGVAEVDPVGDWSGRVFALLTTLRGAALFLGILGAAACVWVIGGTVALGLEGRRDEIEVLQLVGATPGFVRGPLLVEGAILGLLGTALAAGLLFALFRLVGPHAAALLEHAFGGGEIAFLPPLTLAGACLAGAVLGVFGSWIGAARRVGTP